MKKKILSLCMAFTMLFSLVPVEAAEENKISINVPKGTEWADDKETKQKIWYGEPDVIVLKKYMDLKGEWEWSMEDPFKTGAELTQEGNLIVKTTCKAGTVLVTAKQGEENRELQVELCKQGSYCYGGVVYSEQGTRLKAPTYYEEDLQVQFDVRVYDQYGNVMDFCDHKIFWSLTPMDEKKNKSKELNGITINNDGLLTVPAGTIDQELRVSARLSCWNANSGCANGVIIWGNGKAVVEQELDGTITKEMILKVDSPEVIVDSKKVMNDSVPVVVNGTTFLPIRIVAENMGASIGWDGSEKAVTITSEDTEIIVYLDRTDAVVNGEQVQLAKGPFVKDGRTYLPVRFVSERLGAEVEWNGMEKTITIRK